MERLADLLFLAFGALIGWIGGLTFGILGAFLCMFVGAAGGLYLSRRLAQRYLP
jgi:hypothetical protein